ncbi:MAG: DUF1971 domain-containing protein [Acidimicrobiales bacterium]
MGDRMDDADVLPPGLELTRTTPTFTEETVPAGLLAAHRTAPEVWGRLVVERGSLTFRFEDAPGAPIPVAAGGHVVIPPGRPHHVELDGPVAFAVEFHRRR